MNVPEPKKLPSGAWFIQLRLNGVSVPVTALTAKECRDKAVLIKAEHRAGKRAQGSKGDTIALRTAINNYISVRSNALSPATVRGYNTIRDNRFAGVMDKRIKDVKDWQSVCNAEAKLCSAKTLKNAWGLISSVIRDVTGQLPPNITLPQVVLKEKPFLDPEQIKVFVAAVKGSPCEIPALLALSSLRRSEICAITWENIDLKNRKLLVAGALVPNADHKFVQKETNKNTSSRRYVPIMMDALCDALSVGENRVGTVVVISPNTICNQINNICKANSLPRVGVHGLRHSFASLAYHLGMPEKMAMQIGGWADSATMHKIYTHLAQQDVSKYEKEMTLFYKNANENANEIQKT